MNGVHTPTLWLFALLLLGVVLANIFSVSLLVAALLLLGCLLLLLFRGWVALIYPLVVCMGLLTARVHMEKAPLFAVEQSATLAIEVEGKSRGRVIALRQPSGEWLKCNSAVALWSAEPLTPFKHHVVVARGEIKPLDASHDGYSEMLADRGIFTRVIIGKVLGVSEEKREPFSSRLNGWALERLQRLELHPEAFSLSAAVGLAYREGLDKGLVEQYARSGTSHLLALSGLHMGVVLLLLSLVTYGIPQIQGGHIIADVLSIIGIWLCAFMVGLGASVLRSAWMFSLLFMGRIASRRYDSLNSLFAAASIIICFDPAAIFDVSFQLSFSAVAAIIVVGAPLCRLVRTEYGVVNTILHSIIIGIVSTVATAPLISHYFGYFVASSALSTVPLLLLLPIIIIATLLWVLFPIAPLAPFAWWSIEVATTLQNYLVGLFASWSVGYVDYRFSSSALFVSYTAIIALSVVVSRALGRYFERR